MAKATATLPSAVLEHALRSRHVPGLPRLAVESYWRSHPVRADRLARALAERTGTPPGWRWGEGTDAWSSFRRPPSPFREAAHGLGPGFCCICGQPVYGLGWHTDIAGVGRTNNRASWHACCVTAWRLWTAPNQYRKHLAKLQNRRCAETGARLLRTGEVDHRIPLFQVWRDRRETDWPTLLAYWGAPNLQVLNRPAHVAKTVMEAGDRARAARPGLQTYPSARVESPDWRFSGRGMPTVLNPAST